MEGKTEKRKVGWRERRQTRRRVLKDKKVGRRKGKRQAGKDERRKQRREE